MKRHSYTYTLDRGTTWKHLRHMGWEDMRRRSDVYQARGRPLGETAWAFGMWVAYETWTTTN